MHSMKTLISIVFAFVVSIIFTIYPGTINVRWLFFDQTYPIAVFGLFVFLLIFCISIISKLIRFTTSIGSFFKNIQSKRKEKTQNEILFNGFIDFEKENFKDAVDKISKCDFFGLKNDLSNFILGNCFFLENDIESARFYFSSIGNHILRTKGLVVVALKEKEWMRAFKLLESNEWTLSRWGVSKIAWLRIKLLKTKTKISFGPQMFNDRQLGLEAFVKGEDLKFAYESTKDIPEIAIEYAKTQNHEKASSIIFESFNKTPHRSLVDFYLKNLTNHTLDSYKILKENIKQNCDEAIFCLINAAKKFGFQGDAENFSKDLKNSNYFWKCSNCKTLYVDWDPICDSCFGVDCIEWSSVC